MKKKDIEFYMRCAQESAKRSYARRKKVGSVIVTENNIMIPGYNGTLEGEDNNCEDEVQSLTTGAIDLVTKPTVLHAEMNSLRWLARQGISSKGATLFVTLSPCVVCSQHMIGLGISSVYYSEEYRDNSGIVLLEKKGVHVEQVILD